MNITHVIRGEEHISNTPRQILIQEALGYERPLYAHYPLFLSAERSKLSKRKGDVAVRDYRAQGYLPEALVNFIGTLGWTPPSGREVLSLEEMIAEFSLKDLHKSGAVFDIEKLRWFNRQYVQKLSAEDFSAYALTVLESALKERNIPYDVGIGERLVPVIRERISVSDDIREMVTDGEFDYYFGDPTLDADTLPQKGTENSEAALHLGKVHEVWSATPSEIFQDAERLKNTVWEYATTNGRGNVLWPLRYTL